MTRLAKILIVTRALPFHGLGGMEAVAWDLARAFVAAGEAVTVVTTSCPGLDGTCRVDGVEIRPLPVPPGRYSNGWWRESRKVFEQDYARSTDVILSISAGALSMARHRSQEGPVFVAQAHGTAWGELVSKLRQSSPIAWAKSAKNLVSMVSDRAYRNFDAFVAVGDAVRDGLTSNPTRAIVGRKPVYTISNGVNVGRFAFDDAARCSIRARLGIGNADRVVLSASRLHEQKGVMEGVEAFIRAANLDPSLHYIVAGDGPEGAKLRDRAHSSNVASRIHFVGGVPRDDMRAWLSAADVFFFPTKRVEGLALNILEARAAGLQVIASRAVADTRLGVTAVDPADGLALTHAIQTFRPYAPTARTSLLPEEFTLSYAASAYLDLFEKLRSLPRRGGV